MPKKIAVVGAGIAGLTCAYELQQHGFDVVVFEKNNYVGGRMASRRKNMLLFDIGADHLCNLYQEIRKYCAAFAIPWEKMRFEKYGIWRDGKIRSMEKIVGWKTKKRLAVEFLKTKDQGLSFLNLSKAAQWDIGSAYDAMLRSLGQEAVDYLIDPFSSTYEFHSAKQISYGAFKAIMQSLKYEEKDWRLHRTQGGMSAIPEAMAQKLNVKLNTPVQSVKGGSIVSITSDTIEHFDAVVLACTADVSSAILQNPNARQKELLENTQYSTTISVAFQVPAEALENQPSVVWVPRKESASISGYVNELYKGEELQHKGKSLLCTWLHEDFARPLLDASDEEIFTAVKKELLTVCPWFNSAKQLETHDLQRWPAAMPKFAPGHLQRVKTFLENEQGQENVYLCGDYMNSPWTEGALRCGQRVAEQIRQRFHAGSSL